MAKTLVVDQVEVTASGAIQIRMHKLSSDGDLIGNHRTSVDANGDIDAQFAAVNANLADEGFQPASVADIAKVKAIALAAWS